MEELDNTVKNTGSICLNSHEKKEWTVAWTPSQRTKVQMWNMTIKDFNTLCLLGDQNTKFASQNISTFSLEMERIAT